MIDSIRQKGSWLTGFARRQDGAVSVEAVLWLPVFIGFFVLIVDATMIMSGQAQALRVVQDANRGMSVGLIDSAADAEAFIQARLSSLSQNVTVATDITAGVITTNISMPSRDLVASGLLNVFTNITVRVSAQHRGEF